MKYTGNLGDDVLGVVAGPDLHGALYEAVATVYDVDNDVTHVQWKPVSPSDPRSIVPDAFGTWRVDD